MTTPPKVLWKAAEIRERGHAYEQRLNPGSTFVGTGLSRLAGLQRAHVSLARVPPGKDSFAYHAHLLEEEWMYVVSGQGIAEIDGADHEIGPGDFLGFPAGAPAHLVKNRGAEDLVYLMGGDHQPLDVVEYPHLGKRYLLVPTPSGTEFHELGPSIKPFGRKP
jgi:uncharacterized cupin superfamily protein